MCALIQTNGLQRSPNLRSGRLSFQPLVESDVQKVVDFLSDYETVLLLTYAPWPYTLNDAVIWFNYVNQMCANNVGRFWGIHDAENTLIGTIGLSLFPDHKKAEIHYWLGKAYWGQGYGTESAHRIIRYAFENCGVDRLEVNCMARNARSQRVIQKNHFVYEGTLRHYVLRFGVHEDVQFYSLLRDEFKNDALFK